MKTPHDKQARRPWAPAPWAPPPFALCCCWRFRPQLHFVAAARPTHTRTPKLSATGALVYPIPGLCQKRLRLPFERR